MSLFNLTSSFQPKGDQPHAIKQLVEGINRQEKYQTLLGVTGSGKTFTAANVIQQIDKPTLILSHNKTLAAQLYGEFQQFFPDNLVEYFISYYDYYQPEAYIPSSNVYIEKDLSINEEIEKLRLRATSALMSGRKDVIVVSSVSCIYGMGNPEDFSKNTVRIQPGQVIGISTLLYQLVDILYNRTTAEFKRGTFRVKGDTVDIFPAYLDYAFRIYFWGDEIEAIHSVDSDTGKKIAEIKDPLTVFPANLFVTGKDALQNAIHQIQDDMVAQIKAFDGEGKIQESKRIQERTEFDIEMMRELGYCSGIENYSRYFDGRKPGSRPFCLLDYFPDDYLMLIDESHVTLPQVRAMWGGDRSRKVSLVDYGFRLPAAMDNRPLTFNEFEDVQNQVIYLSATPGDYEMQQTDGVVVEQLIRPTGLTDPLIEVRPSINQMDDVLEEVHQRVEKNERVLMTTLTKRMAEELSKFFDRVGIKNRYIHSEVKTLDRVEILRELRLGIFDVLVGVNLLREGLDLPEVSLVVIFDADKEGFLRNHRSMIQTIGRAARNVNGRVIMYADKMTDSMSKAIDETHRRRQVQIDFNTAHGIIPETVKKSTDKILEQTQVADAKRSAKKYDIGDEVSAIAADPVMAYMSKDELTKLAEVTKKKMEKASQEMNFIEAASLRDEYLALEKKVNSM
ncbi:MAG: excinuclease ABC subunit UvrB [Cyclobacteriaceae bacterium]